MKRIVALFLVILVFSSCVNNDDSFDHENIDSSFKEITNSTVGYENNEEVIFAVSKELILEKFIEFAKENNIDIIPTSFEVIEIEGKKYLRFYGDHTASTIALFKDRNNKYITGSTICTSSACAFGGGCLPEGKFCTACKPKEGNSYDCLKTTTD